MQELARRLDITDTEANRQLLHLSEASLVQKQPDGAYSLTEYGNLASVFPFIRVCAQIQAEFAHAEHLADS